MSGGAKERSKGVSDGLKDGQYLIQKNIFEFLSMVLWGSLGPPDFKKSVESAAVDFLRHDSDVQWLRANTVSDRMATPGDNAGRQRRRALLGSHLPRVLQVDGVPGASRRASGGNLRRSFCWVPPKADRS